MYPFSTGTPSLLGDRNKYGDKILVFEIFVTAAYYYDYLLDYFRQLKPAPKPTMCTLPLRQLWLQANAGTLPAIPQF